MITPWASVEAVVQRNEAIDQTMHHLVVEAPRIARFAEAGQFVVVVPGGPEHLDLVLPRPFDLHHADADDGTIEVVYRVKGKGTRELAQLRPGSHVVVNGPFGRPVREVISPGSRIALIGRGAGISPLCFVAMRAWYVGAVVDAYLSARKRVLLAPFLARLGHANVFEQTDDVDPGVVVTDWLEEQLGKRPIDAAFVVGSRRLTRATADLAKKNAFVAYCFAETYMGCGFGHCKGCTIPTHDGYKLACVDGPAIDVQELSDAYWDTIPY